DHVIAILDRSPATGVAALLEVSGLTTDERYKIGAVIHDVVQQMDNYALPPPVPSKVEPVQRDEESWPVDFDILQARHEPGRARAISPSTLELVSKHPMQANWLVELALYVEPESFKLLMNIKRCDHVGDTYVIVAQPFALGGDIKQRWMQL